MSRFVRSAEGGAEGAARGSRGEVTLQSLGYGPSIPVDWSTVRLPSKVDLLQEMHRRVLNFTNTDFVVHIGSEEFHCHLLVLQCYSSYFDHQMVNRDAELPISNVTPQSFQTIYDWMIFNGSDSYQLLRRNNVLDVFAASQFLGIKDLEEQCWAFIDNEMLFNEDTAFMLFMEAKKRGNTAVMDLMVPRVQKFFLPLVAMQDFVNLSVKDVLTFLSSNHICVTSEMEVLLSVVRWTLGPDEEARTSRAPELLGRVRFGLMAPWQLVDARRNPDNPELLGLLTSPRAKHMLDDGLAYVIIKYWYGNNSEDYHHWIDVLGLAEPEQRNWICEEKNHATYSDFLEFLEMFKVPRSQLNDLNGSEVGGAVPSQASAQPIMPAAMSEFFEGRKGASPPEAGALDAEAGGASPASSAATDNPTATAVRATSSPTLMNFDMRNKLSASVLGPPSKNYMKEGSLFNWERETVLVFGGIDPHSGCGTPRNSGRDIFKYDPILNTWDFVGDLPEPRHHHSVAFLKGRVFLVGGADPRNDDVRGKSVVVSTVWSYEPVTRSWYSESGLNVPRKNFGLVVHHMKLYAIGGQDRKGRVLATVERFDPRSGAWSSTRMLGTARAGAACCRHRDYIWVAGGLTARRHQPLTDSVEYYNDSTDQWTRITDIRFPRCFGSMFSMKDRLYLVGGAGRLCDEDRTTSSVGAVDVWDEGARSWRLQAEMAIPRHGHALACLGTQLLIAGGVSTVRMRGLSDVETYCCERLAWIRGVAPLAAPLSGHAAATLPPAALI